MVMATSFGTRDGVPVIVPTGNRQGKDRRHDRRPGDQMEKSKEVKTEKTAEKTDMELKASMSRFIHKYEKFSILAAQFLRDINDLRAEFVLLENRRLTLERELKFVEIQRARTELDAANRIQTVNEGHRELIKKLTDKETKLIELQEALSQKSVELKHRAEEVELLKSEYERKLKAGQVKR